MKGLLARITGLAQPTQQLPRTPGELSAMLTEFETLQRLSKTGCPEAAPGSRAKSAACRLEEFQQNNRIFVEALRASGYQPGPAGPTPTKRTS